MNRRSVGNSARAGFALAIVALLLSGGLSFFNIRRIDRNAGLVVHTHEVLDELRDTLGSLAEAESSQRSYLITGEKSYLEPQREAVAEALAHMKRLKSLTVDNELQQQRLVDLEPRIELRLDSLQHGITIRDAEGVDGARRYVLAGKGKREMATIRDLIGDINKTEMSLLAARETESKLSYHTAVVTQWVTTILGLGLVVAAYLLAARELETRRNSTEALARANDELEDRVEGELPTWLR